MERWPHYEDIYPSHEARKHGIQAGVLAVKSHLVASSVALKEGSTVRAVCKAEIKKAVWEKGDFDLRFHDQRGFVNCRKCLKAEDPKLIYNYVGKEAK